MCKDDYTLDDKVVCSIVKKYASSRVVLRKIRTEVKRLRRQAENDSSGIQYDYQDIGRRCGEACAYEKVLAILERLLDTD